MRFLLEIVFTVSMLRCVFGELVEGDPCTIETTGQRGRCQHIFRCAAAVDEAFKGISPQVCTIVGTLAIVCYPLIKVAEGDSCIMEESLSSGACTQFADCRVAILAATKGIVPQKCDPYSFGKEGQLICCSEPCPPLSKALVSQQRNGSKAADYCIELAEQIYPCQRTSIGWARGDTCPAIPDPSAEYDGTHLNSITEAPYYGWLGFGEEEDIRWQVGSGNLLSDRWLVTSAHVIEVAGSGNTKYVGLGWSFNPYSADVIYNIHKIVIHPKYNSTTSIVYNDIALVEVDRQIDFTSRILPACLHTGTPLPNSGLIHTGWVDALEAYVKTSMKLVPQEECAGIFTVGTLHPDGVQHQIEFCSRPVNSSGPCEGFGPGSPLSLYNGPKVACTHLLVGIVSAWDPTTCTIMYTRVSGFIPWIESTMWP